MKIYVITNGIYSDYHICGVATDYDTAEKIRKHTSDRYDESRIEEYETDTWSDIVRIGGIYHVNKYGEYLQACRENYDVEATYNKRNVVMEYGDDSKGVNVIAKDEDHAKKIAADLFAKYEAEKHGI